MACPFESKRNCAVAEFDLPEAPKSPLVLEADQITHFVAIAHRNSRGDSVIAIAL